MVGKLVPSVLATTAGQLRRRVTIAKQLSRSIHLDVMDGRFVAYRSTPLGPHLRLLRDLGLEMHLMVRSPERYWGVIKKLRPRLVYLPIELGTQLVPALRHLRSLGVVPGVAINPSTPVDRLRAVPSSIRDVLIMSVRPGRYHAPYLTATSKRIIAIRKQWPQLRLTCDGGMNTTTIPIVRKAGVSRCIVGSDLMFHPEPAVEWRRLQQLTK